MTGRQIFSKLKPLIYVISKCISVFPSSFKRFLWDLFRYTPTKIGIGIRYVLARSLIDDIGDNVLFGTGLQIVGWDNLHIGSNVTLHKDCYIDSSGGLYIGDNVSVAHMTSILTFEHTYSDASLPIKYNKLIFDEVTIEDDVWIGCGVRILSGARISSRSIVAAGAVLVKGQYDPGIYGGVPARKIKCLL